jgi:hypothetical protein
VCTKLLEVLLGRASGKGALPETLMSQCDGDGRAGQGALPLHGGKSKVRRRRLVVRVSPKPSACAGAPIEIEFGRSEATTKLDLKANYVLAATCLVTL